MPQYSAIYNIQSEVKHATNYGWNLNSPRHCDIDFYFHKDHISIIRIRLQQSAAIRFNNYKEPQDSPVEAQSSQ